MPVSLLCERCGACVIDSDKGSRLMQGQDIISLSFVCENCKGRRNFGRPFSII